MRSVKRIILVLVGHSSYGREIAKGVYGYCGKRRDWDIFYQALVNEFTVQNLQLALDKWGADGVIGQLNDEKLTRLLFDKGIRTVNVSENSVIAHPTVQTSIPAIASLAAKYFLDKGLTSLAYCGTNWGRATSELMQCFCDVSAKAGVACQTFCVTEDTGWLVDSDKIAQWLRGLPKPVGVLVPNDYCGRNLAWLCRRFGVRVPAEVAILGCGNDDMQCWLSQPPLSSVIRPARLIGQQAAALLDGILDKKIVPSAKPILIPPPGIVERQSTDILKIVDPHVAAAVRFIHEHAREAITVEDICKAAHLSRNALDQRFLKLLGRTPRAELNRVRIARAQQMLRDCGLKITSVATQAGFGCYPRFRQLFHKETGLTPAEYRFRCLPS
jgi:LacI family transcriptional regulator